MSATSTGPADHYDLLGVDRNATIEQVNRAYKAAARKAHPDLGGDPDLFHQVKQAHKTLSDPIARARYDASRAAAAATPRRPTPAPQPADAPAPTAAASGGAAAVDTPDPAGPASQVQAASAATVYGTARTAATRRVAAALDTVDLDEHTHVFWHTDLDSHPVDVALVDRWARLLTVHVIELEPGRWEWDSTTSQALHDGQPAAQVTAQLATAVQASSHLIRATNWATCRREWGRLLVFAPADGAAEAPDTARLTHPQFDCVRSDQATSWFDRWRTAPPSSPGHPPVEELARLAAATGDEHATWQPTLTAELAPHPSRRRGRALASLWAGTAAATAGAVAAGTLIAAPLVAVAAAVAVLAAAGAGLWFGWGRYTAQADAAPQGAVRYAAATGTRRHPLDQALAHGRDPRHAPLVIAALRESRDEPATVTFCDQLLVDGHHDFVAAVRA